MSEWEVTITAPNGIKVTIRWDVDSVPRLIASLWRQAATLVLESGG